MRPTRRGACRACGTPIVWIPSLDRRPIEAKPVEPCDGDIGYVVVRRGGRNVWEPSSQHPDATEHVRVHRCFAWRDSHRDPATLESVVSS